MSLSPGVHAIVELSYQIKSGDSPRDYMTNTLHFNSGAPTVTGAQWQALTDAISGVFFASSGSWLFHDTYGGRTIAYDYASPKPRPEQAVTIHTPSTWATDYGAPRQVALCLSYYCQRNLKRQRGRIYVPLKASEATAAERPTTTTMNKVLALGTQLKTVLLGLTPAWTHEVISTVDATDFPIDHYWVNDVWDIQRRRAPKETTRVHDP